MTFVLNLPAIVNNAGGDKSDPVSTQLSCEENLKDANRTEDRGKMIYQKYLW
jgi:hypothetical protein